MSAITDAKRANRATLELAKELADGDWHTTSALAVIVGSYIRPEIASRTAQAKGTCSLIEGRRTVVNSKLIRWEKAGRIEKCKDGHMTKWRLARNDWIVPYLSVLVDILRNGRR